jgi:hypothetical protein
LPNRFQVGGGRESVGCLPTSSLLVLDVSDDYLGGPAVSRVDSKSPLHHSGFLSVLPDRVQEVEFPRVVASFSALVGGTYGWVLRVLFCSLTNLSLSGRTFHFGHEERYFLPRNFK